MSKKFILHNTTHPAFLKAKWPQERDLKRYSELAGIDIAKHLNSGGKWMDIGCGKGVALSELINQCDLLLIGVTPSPIEIDSRVIQVNSLIPNDRKLLQQYRGTLQLSSDIFGALSYCDNPLEALLYEALLLAPQGIAVVATRPERFGEDVDTQNRIKSFFNIHLGYSIEFDLIQTISDATHKPVGVLQIKVTAPNRSQNVDLDKLMTLSKREIGAPTKTRPAWTSEDGNAQIWQVDYKP